MTATHRIATLVALLLAVPAKAGPFDSPAHTRVPCADLTQLTFEGNTTVTAATVVTSGTLVTSSGLTLTNLPAFCRVQGLSQPTSDSNIYFEVWLPADTWNGRFLSSGEGGYAGQLNYTRRGLDGGLDIQTALESWVENGHAPDMLIATKYVDDNAATRTILLDRPLCLYPLVPRYRGGAPNDAASFDCVPPSR